MIIFRYHRWKEFCPHFWSQSPPETRRSAGLKIDKFIPEGIKQRDAMERIVECCLRTFDEGYTERDHVFDPPQLRAIAFCLLRTVLAPTLEQRTYPDLPVSTREELQDSLQGALVLHGMGSGKTRTGLGLIAAIGHLYQKKQSKAFIFVAVPKGVLKGWTDTDEALKSLIDKVDYVQIVPVRASSDFFNHTEGSGVTAFVMTHNMYRNTAADIARFQASRGSDCVLLVDEGHRGMGSGGNGEGCQFARAVQQFPTKMRVALTGTPPTAEEKMTTLLHCFTPTFANGNMSTDSLRKLLRCVVADMWFPPIRNNPKLQPPLIFICEGPRVVDEVGAFYVNERKG